MQTFFFKIDQWARRHALWAVAMAVVYLLLFGWLSSKLSFEEDVSKLIPASNEEKLPTRVLSQLNFADNISVLVSAPSNAEPTELPEAAAYLESEIRKRCAPYLKSIQARVGEEQTQNTIEFVYGHLPFFLSAADYESIDAKLNRDSISNIADANLRAMLSPSGMVTAQYIRRDPLGLAFRALEKLKPSGEAPFTIENGYLTRLSGREIALFLTPNQPASETDANSALAEHIYDIQRDFHTKFPGLQCDVFGAALVSVANASQIKSDIQLSTGVAMTALMLILALFYRRWFIPLLIFLPTAFALVFSLALLYVLKGKISAISLGIGAILIGITIDYALHILTHYKQSGSLKSLYKALTRPLFMSAATTAIAFLCLLFVKSEALQDLGIFAASIVMASAFFSLLLIPQFYRPDGKSVERTHIIERLSRFAFEKNKILVWGTVLLVGVCAMSFHRVTFNSDISQLNYIPAHLQQARAKLEGDQAGLKSIYVAAHAAHRADAILANESAYELLQALQKEGDIEYFTSIGHFALSDAKQTGHLRQWESFWTDEKKKTVRDLFVSEGAKLGMNANTYSAFFEYLDKDFKPPGMDKWQEFEALQFDQFVSVRQDLSTVLSVVKVKPENREKVLSKLAAHEFLLAIDRQQMNERFLDRLQTDFSLLVNLSFGAILLVLFAFFRRFELVLLSSIPIALTAVVTAGLMAWFTIELNIFSSIVCTLVFGHGVDFSIFMTSALQKEHTTGRNQMPVYRTSILLAVLTTVLGIGALVFAKHPALRSISAVALIGVSAAVLITFVLYPILFRFFISARPARGKAPLRFWRTIHSVLSFAYYGLGGILLSLVAWLVFKILPISKARKLLVFHRLMSSYMLSVFWTYPRVKRKVLNPANERFEKPAIVIANHSSFLDILALGSLSTKLVFMVSDWVYRSPVIGLGVRLAGFYPASRGIEGGLDHLKKKIDQGYSLVIFPEGTRSSDNSIKRFKKGAFFLAETFSMDIVPVVIHGLSEVAPKGDFILNPGRTTLEVLPRIPFDSEAYGTDYASRTKNINRMMRTHYAKMRLEFEPPDYFKAQVLESFDYKEQEVVRSVRKDLDRNSKRYHWIGRQIKEGSRLLHFGQDFGQIDVLLALMHPGCDIDSITENEEASAIASTNYIAIKRGIRYTDAPSGVYDLLLVSGFSTQIETDFELPRLIVLCHSNLIAYFAARGYVQKAQFDANTVVLEKA